MSFSVRSLFCYAVLCVLSIFTIISLENRELVAVLLLSSGCPVAVIKTLSESTNDALYYILQHATIESAIEIFAAQCCPDREIYTSSMMFVCQ